ncbi:MAG: hypothetical protein KJ727_02270, partial [Acidobacteria bacterium]|nr:hypothetical protein [Acidobacteriota bacterium]
PTAPIVGDFTISTFGFSKSPEGNRSGGPITRPDEGIISSDLSKLTPDLKQKLSTSISRDGTKAAFTAFGGALAQRFELRIRDLTTGQETTVPTQTMSLSFSPQISPDGMAVGFRDRVAGKWRPFVYSLNEASSREVGESGRILDFFSGNEFALIIDKPDELEKMNLRTGDRTPVLTTNPDTITGAGLSPDNEWIAYSTGEPDGQAAIWIAPLATASTSGEGKIFITRDDRYLSSPKWSPNGRYLYFLSEKSGACSLYAQNLDPKTKEPAGEARMIYFSPDSSFHLNFPKGHGEIGVAEDKIIFKVSKMDGNIFVATPKKR